MTTQSTASVRLVKYVKDGDTWRYIKVSRFNNGKIKPDPRPGKYYLDWLEGKKRRRSVIGPDPQEALNALQRKEHMLAGAVLGVPTPADTTTKRNLHECVEEFLDSLREHRGKKTFAASRLALLYFEESCDKTYLEDLTRDDLLNFKAHLKRKQLSDRTISNQWERLLNFLKEYDITHLHKKGSGGDAPVFTEQAVETYTPDELQMLFYACDEDEGVLFAFFLRSGMRDKEVAHFYKQDVDFENNVLRVRAKPELKWKPKKNKERELPLHPDLVEPLKKYLARHKDDPCPLLFPSKKLCLPETKFLRRLQKVVIRAKLDAGRYWIHKFRATFATTALHAGVDLSTVQEWMGHTDLKSTMRYLKPAGGKAAQDKMAKLKF